MKIIVTSQGHIHKYEDLKRQLYNCIDNIYFNKKCLRKNVIPNFAVIKIPNTSPASKFTQQITSIIRIKDEKKYLCIKKKNKRTALTTMLNFSHFIEQLIALYPKHNRKK
jgi:hypothetical protein